jgi:hypothetical protein
MCGRPLFPSAIRRGIATDNPMALAMWKDGRSLKDIAVALGYSPQSNATSVLGVIDPRASDPVPRGIPAGEWRPGESDEARCFRRFPIDKHKRGG